MSQDTTTAREEVVEQACQVIKKLSDKIYSPSLYEDEYPTFDLGNQETLENLNSELAKHNLQGYFQYGIRKEWNADTGILTLRPIETEIRDRCASLVLDALMEEIERVTNVDSYYLQDFRNNFERYGRRHVHTGLASDNFPRFFKSPDGQILYKDRIRPNFVVEIGYRQPVEQMYQRMKEYMQHGPGDEFTVLAINIEYALPHVRLPEGHFHQASVSLWAKTKVHRGSSCTHYVSNLVQNPIFRNSDGEAMKGELLIPFKLLLPRKEHSKIPWEAKSAQLQLNYELLSEIVRSAEEAQREFDTGYLPAIPERKIRWRDTNGQIIREEIVPARKRQRISPHWRDAPEIDSTVLPDAPQSATSSLPRRSSRIAKAKNRGTSATGNA